MYIIVCVVCTAFHMQSFICKIILDILVCSISFPVCHFLSFLFDHFLHSTEIFCDCHLSLDRIDIIV